MKVLICEDRNWDNYSIIKNYVEKLPKDVIIIEGGCRGADRLSKMVAIQLSLKFIEVKAEWNKYGKSAGPIRNRKMLDMKPDIVIAFHNNIDKSKGTKDCINEAKKRGMVVRIVKENE